MQALRSAQHGRKEPVDLFTPIRCRSGHSSMALLRFNAMCKALDRPRSDMHREVSAVFQVRSCKKTILRRCSLNGMEA